jgi:hypothetical protein
MLHIFLIICRSSTSITLLYPCWSPTSNVTDHLAMSKDWSRCFEVTARRLSVEWITCVLYLLQTAGMVYSPPKDSIDNAESFITKMTKILGMRNYTTASLKAKWNVKIVYFPQSWCPARRWFSCRRAGRKLREYRYSNLTTERARS